MRGSVDMKTGFIYIIRNTENDKVYVGQTTLTPHERFMQHMKDSTLKDKGSIELYIAVKEIGKDKFYVETLESNVPIEKLDEREIFYIEKYNSCDSGYNATKGGKGGVSLSISEQKEILNLAKQGKTAIEISKLYSVHKMTVLRTLHNLGFWYYGMNLELLKDMVEKGKTNKEIANAFGISVKSVPRVLDRNGMRKNNKPFRQREDIDFSELKSDYQNQMTINDICRKHIISRSTFYRITKELGLPKRTKIR